MSNRISQGGSAVYENLRTRRIVRSRVDLLCEELSEGWKTGRKPSVEQILERENDLSPEDVLSLIREEIRARALTGEPAADWTRRFPNYREQIDRLLCDQSTRLFDPEKIFHVKNVTLPRQNAQSIPGYEILGELGRGGMGVVYRARQLNVNRIVAIKMVLAGSFASEDDLTRFQREAEAVAALNHPNIVQIHEMGEYDGYPYFTLEYIEGGTLAERIKQGPLPPRQAAALTAAIARGVHAAHQHHIVHRDLKPANILLPTNEHPSASGSRVDDCPYTPKITDFGVAKRTDLAGQLTSSGVAAGTPQYMSPEQVGARPDPVGPASDIWSIGILLYEMLAQHPPFEAVSPVDVFRRIANELPSFSESTMQKIPADLKTILLKCLEKEPNRRYGTAALLAEDLERFISNQPIRARRVGPLGLARRWCRRNPLVAGMLLGIMMLMAIGTSVSSWLAVRADSYRRDAEEKSGLAQIETIRAQRAEEFSQLALLKEGELRHQANAREAQRSRELYASNMSLAYNEFLLGHVDNTDRIVRSYLPTADQPADSRGFEWYYLQSLIHAYSNDLNLESSLVSAARHPNGKDWMLTTNKGVAFWQPERHYVDRRFYSNDRVYHAAISPDTRYLAMATSRPEVIVIDLRTAETKRFPYLTEWTQAKAHPIHVQFSPDSKTLAAALGVYDIRESNGRVVLWSVETGAIQKKIAERVEFVRCLKFSRDGKTLYVAGMNRSVDQFETATGNHLKTIELSQHVVGMAISAKEDYLAIGSPFGSIILVELPSGKVLRHMSGHRDWVRSLDFSPDGTLLATGAAEGTVRVWNVSDGTEREHFGAHTGAIEGLVYDVSGTSVLTAGRDGRIRIWSNDREQPPYTDWVRRTLLRYSSQTISFNRYPVEMKRFSGDRYLLMACEDGHFLVLDAKDQRVLSGSDLLGGERKGSIWRFALSADGRQLFVPHGEGKTNGEARLYQVSELTSNQPRFDHQWNIQRNIFGCDFHPNTNEIACSYADGKGTGILILDSASGKVIREWKCGNFGPNRLQYSPDGETLIGDLGNEVVVWNRQGDELLRMNAQGGRARYFCVSPDAQRIASAHQDGRIRIWNATTGELIYTLIGHSKGVHTLCFDQTGNRLVSSSEDLSVRVWDMSTGLSLLVLDDQDRMGVRVSFAMDDSKLIAVNRMGLATIWNASRGRSLDQVRQFAESLEFSQLKVESNRPGEFTFKYEFHNRTDQTIHLPEHSKELPPRAVAPNIYITLESEATGKTYPLGIDDVYYGGPISAYVNPPNSLQLEPQEGVEGQLSYWSTGNYVPPGRYRIRMQHGFLGILYPNPKNPVGTLEVPDLDKLANSK